MGVWVLQNKELPETETCQALLDRILASPQLKRSTRMRELLAYVGRRALENGCEQLHEQEIGTDVFGRPAGYDTSVDNIVRVNATELRKRIDAFFETEGVNEPLIMEIPRGSYIPVFRYRPVESPITAGAEIPALVRDPEPHPAADVGPQLLPLPMPAPPAVRRWPWIAATILAGLAALVFGITCLRLTSENRTMHQRLFPWEYQPAVSAFWSGFLGANPTTDLVLSDTAFGMFQTLSKRSFSLQDYLNRSYAAQVQQQNLDPQVHSMLAMLARRTLVSRGEFNMAQHLDDLDPLNTQIHMYFARSYIPSLLKRHNVVLFGTRLSNPWMELFENRLAFAVQRNADVADPAAPGVPRLTVNDRSPAAGEQATYIPSTQTGYCTVAYLPNPEHTGKVLLIEGTTSEAAEGCGEFLLSEPGMENLERKLGTTKFPYFQVLLRTSQLIDTPITATIVADRVFTNLR
ncbi:MAG TPA: hypothetical protein VGR47_20445 [Terracidiphilus sp.]|nr:hypothetical protein [Terracidiphilus sp.]